MAVKVPLSRVINYLFNHAVIFVILCSIIQSLLYARLIGNGLFDFIMRTLFVKFKNWNISSKIDFLKILRAMPGNSASNI